MSFAVTHKTRSPRPIKNRSNEPETCRQSSSAQTRSPPRQPRLDPSARPMRGGRQRGGCAPRPTGRGARPHSSWVYLQPGVVVVWPGGWHLALASCGPPPLLPGPNDGSASADGASAPSNAHVDSAIAIRLRSGLIQTSLVVFGPRATISEPRTEDKAAG